MSSLQTISAITSNPDTQEKRTKTMILLGETIGYQELVLKRREVYKEEEAMRIIVSMANMNVKVLMADVLNKKRTVITRIDSTPEGFRILCEAAKYQTEGTVGQEVLERLRVARRLQLLRKTVNTELQTYQNGWNKFPIAANKKEDITNRYIQNKIDYYTEAAAGLTNSTAAGSTTEAYIYIIIVEELKEIIQNII
jgi:hypothetical protein